MPIAVVDVVGCFAIGLCAHSTMSQERRPEQAIADGEHPVIVDEKLTESGTPVGDTEQLVSPHGTCSNQARDANTLAIAIPDTPTSGPVTLVASQLALGWQKVGQDVVENATVENATPTMELQTISPCADTVRDACVTAPAIHDAKSEDLMLNLDSTSTTASAGAPAAAAGAEAEAANDPRDADPASGQTTTETTTTTTTTNPRAGQQTAAGQGAAPAAVEPMAEVPVRELVVSQRPGLQKTTGQAAPVAIEPMVEVPVTELVVSQQPGLQNTTGKVSTAPAAVEPMAEVPVREFAAAESQPISAHIVGKSGKFYTIAVGFVRDGCKRRFQEFVDLDLEVRPRHQTLPLLPVKSMFFRRTFKQGFMDDRQEQLGRYISALVADPAVFNEPLVQRFLGLAS